MFFEPRNEFIQWVKEFSDGKLIVDCGCGCANTTATLRMAGVKAIGLDLICPERALIGDIHVIDATDYPFSSDTIGMMCRPNRGDWIHATITKAVESGAKFIYVGKESHYKTDLQPLSYKVQKVMTNAGISNESAWIIER